MDNYVDLEIVIHEAPSQEADAHATIYPVSAFYPGQPRASSTLTLDPAAPPWPEWLERLADVLQEPGAPFLHEVGSALYRALFRDEIAQLWTIAQADLDAARVPGIRIRLAIDPPAIAALPWELLYDADRQRALACRAQHPLVRVVGRIGQVPPQRPIALDLPLHVLFIAPQGTGLNWARELEILQDALGRLKGQAELRSLIGRVTLADLSDLLGSWRPHILHFVTHGTFDGTHGQLLFNAPADALGERFAWVRSDQLHTLLAARGESVRLIMIGACRSAETSPREALAGLGPALIQAGVPAVIGMQTEIRDEAAIVFARALYRGLLEPRWPGQIDAAVAEARAELAAQWPDQQAYAIPVLFLNAEHGRIFLTTESATAALGVSPPAVPTTAEEDLDALKERYGRQPLRDLRERIRALTEQANSLRGSLDALQAERAKSGPIERATIQSYIQSQTAELQAKERELAALQSMVRFLEEANVPEELSLEEFEAGVLTESILEAAVSEQPYEQPFRAADLARWLQTIYPAYWDHVVRRFGSPTDAEQAINDRVSRLFLAGRSTGQRPWFLVRRGDRFVRTRYEIPPAM